MKSSIALNQKNLSSLPLNVRRPTYNRDKVKTSIVHVGVGNFHRSHEEFFTNELMERYRNLNYGICGIGMLDNDRRIYNILKDQDGLYTVMIKELDGTISPHVIGSLIEFLFAPENPIAVVEKMADPDIKIISMTITEGGYNIDKSLENLKLNKSVVSENMKNPKTPKTVFEYLTQAFKLRKERGLPGCTIQSCDNIQGNGDMAKKTLLKYVSKVEPEIKDWIEKNVSFPNAMVDRITPVTVPGDIKRLRDEFMIEDQWPVVCEPFIQWVIEDKFIQGRPEWEKVGAQFVEDVVPYEHMKLRLLNAGHSVLGMLGALHGYKTIDESARDKDFLKFLKDFMDKEATPTLGNLGKVDLKKYKESLISRFQNIYIKDLVSRICLESSAKIPIFLLSTVREQLKKDKNISRAAFIIAAWCKYNDGIDENGNTYNIEDDMSNELIRAAALSHQNPICFLKIKPIFGDLDQNKTFTDSFLKSLEMLRNKKVKDCVIEMNKKLG